MKKELVRSARPWSLAAEASVIGRPSLVVAPNGDGLVTYVASMNDEFDVFAMPIVCALN